MADRHGPLRSPLGTFVESVNGGQISKGGLLVSGADMGFDELSMPQLDGDPAVAGDRVSTVVPAGARAIKIDFALDPSNVLALVPGTALGGTRDPGGGNDVVDVASDGFRTTASEFFPPGSRSIKIASPAPEAGDIAAWLAPDGETDVAYQPEETAVVLFSGERSPSDLFDGPADGPEWRPVEAGESVETARTIFVAPGDVLFGDAGRAASWDAVFDAGSPAPLSGATFAMGVLSTPNATVGGQTVNPLARLDSIDLLGNDVAEQLLRRAGLSEIDDVEWLAGPEPVDVESESSVTVFGEESDAGMETFVGVVDGEDGPWQVVVHVVRATGEDHVIVAGIHRRAVGTAEIPESRSALAESDAVRQARELMADAVARLE